MSGRKYSARKSSTAAVDNDKRRRWPWSELPPTTLIFTNPHILERKQYWPAGIGSSPPAITKSWQQTTTRCNNQRPQLRHVITASSSPSKHSHNHFLGDSSIVDAVYEKPDASHWCLLKCDTTARTHPPPTIPSYQYFNCLGPPLQLNGILGPNSPTTGLMVRYAVYRNVTRSSFWCRHVSIRHECTKPDPFDAKKKLMEFGSVVESEGKYYAMSVQGTLVVMQVDDTRLKITGISAIRAVPSARCRFFKEWLVEMEGEILVVFLIHEKSLAVVDGVEVFRLDFGKLDWIRVGRLRGKTMFLKESCVWVDSAEFGCRDDCVYFTQGLDNSWCLYDMNTCCISPVLLEFE